MVGCATERLVVIVRDELVAGLRRQHLDIPKGLRSWKFKTVRDGITAIIDINKKLISPQRLQEAYSSFWLPFTDQLRLYRNDAGHPVSIEPITPETAHANLLVFPELVVLVRDLQSWIFNHYQEMPGTAPAA